MRARVVSETEPPPFRTLLVVWKLPPERAATSLTDTCLPGLRTLTLRVLCAGKRTFAPTFRGPRETTAGRSSTRCGGSSRGSSDFAGILAGGWMGPRPEYPRPNLRRAEWQSLNGEWDLGVGDRPVF